MTSPGVQAESRANERHPISMHAEVAFGGVAIECETLDISAGGAKVRFRQDPFRNIVLSIAPFGEFTGEIVWKDDEYVGIRFHENQEKMSEAIRTMTGK